MFFVQGGYIANASPQRVFMVLVLIYDCLFNRFSFKVATSLYPFLYPTLPPFLPYENLDLAKKCCNFATE